MPTPQQIALAKVHEALAELVRADVHVEKEFSVKVTSEEAGLIAVLYVAPYDGPARVHLAPGVDPAKFPGAVVPPLFEGVEPPVDPVYILREVDSAVMEVAPLVTERPVAVKKLAVMAGYRYSSYLRSAVQRLVDLGLLVRCSQGVKRAK